MTYRALQPLAGNPDDFMFGVVFGLKADLEFDYKEYGLNYYHSNDPCFACGADCNDGNNNLNEYRADRSTWLNNVYTKTQWALSPYNTHPIFKLPGLSILTVICDVMHCKHIGTDQYYYGSVLVLLCFYMLPGTPSENLSIVWKLIQAYYKSHGTLGRFTNLRFTMFCRYSVGMPDGHEKQMPCLVGRAGEIRSLAPALLYVFQQFRGRVCGEVPATQMAQVELGLKASIRMDVILEENKSCVKCPPVVYDEFATAGMNFLIIFNALGNYYSDVRRPAMKLFNVTIKAHYLCHCILQAKHLNPRLGWCYAGEDVMFRVRRLLASNTKHNSPSNCTNSFATQYRVGMHLLFKNLSNAG